MIGKELIKLVGAIGKKGIYHTNGIRSKVEIMDVKTAYGKGYYLIKSEFGDLKWTREDVIEVLTSEKVKSVAGIVKDVITDLF